MMLNLNQRYIELKLGLGYDKKKRVKWPQLHALMITSIFYLMVRYIFQSDGQIYISI